MNDLNNYILLSNNFFKITSKTSLDRLLHCDEVSIFFSKADQNILLSTDCIIEIATVLHYLLNNCLTGNYQLHSSIQQDIGLVWNEYLQKKIKVEYETNESGEKFWVGIKHEFTSTNSYAPIKCASWFYNNDQGDIIFEITPIYPWHFTDPKKEQVFIAYDRFVKSYKPLAVITIPRDIAQDMLEQTKHILRSLEEKTLKPCKT